MAIFAGEIATCGAKREDVRSRIKVIERFLFDRINAKPGAATVGGEDHYAIPMCPHKTGGPLVFVQAAVARAEVALKAAIG